MKPMKNIKTLFNSLLYNGHLLLNRVKMNISGKPASSDTLPQTWALCYPVLSSLGDAVVLNKVVYNKKGRVIDYEILDVSHPSFEELTGLSREECVGNLASGIYNVSTAPFLKQIEECFSQRQSVKFETFFSTLDKHVVVAIHRLSSDTFITVYSDISERKAKEIELSTSQKLLDSIICQSPDIIYRLDKESRVTFISNAVRNYGYEPEDLIGRPVMDLVHPDDRDKAMYKVNERRTGERSTKTLEIRLKTLKNDAVPFETILVDLEKSPCFTVDAEGQYYSNSPDGTRFAGTQGIMRDVTHRKIALNLLKTTNDELEKKVKYRTEQLEKALDKLIFENASRKQTEEKLRQAGDELEKKIAERSKELLTANKKLKKQITEKQEMYSQLLQIQKMNAVGTLSGGIAHDFNNMLTVINGHAEVGLLSIPKEHPGYRHMLSILKAGKRAENLTRQLLAFSRKQIFQPQVLNINSLIEDLDKMMRRLIGEDIAMKIKLSKNIPAVKGEPGQIEQVLMNLIVNARDAINDNTEIASEKKIIIETKSEQVDEGQAAKYLGLQQGKYVIISVCDTGVGVSEDIQHKIFEPFFTTKEQGHGTGLGLATVYGIVKQNGAYIYVHSEKNQGARFKIYWPVCKEEKLKMNINSNEKNVLSGDEIVLLVEDDINVRIFTSSALRELGYTVYEASNGKKALQIIEEKGLKPHLLITDIVMPEMNGKELVEKLNKKLPEMKIIYTSGYTDSYIAKQGILNESVHFIQKPYSLKNFAGKIREVLEKDNYLV